MNALSGPPYSDSIYRADRSGFKRAVTKDGEETLVPMTNFTAWIVARTMHPESPELNYSEITVSDSTGVYRTERVLDSEFRQADGRGGWLGKFGSGLRVYAGTTNAHLVNAVQVASGDEVPLVVVFARIGWMRDGGQWYYLTPSGALGALGLDDTIRVEPGGRLEDYTMQGAEDDGLVIDAVRVFLDMPKVANSERGVAAIIAVQAAMLRSLLIPARRMNFTITVVGETGSGKSGLTGAVLQAFGPAFGYDHLTDSWSSTLNSLLDMASRACHAPLVIDDYVEIDTGATGVGRQANNRDTLVRMVANAASKGRLNANATRNDGLRPETCLISTQETTGSFRHASEAARQVFIVLEKRGGPEPDISIDKLKDYSRANGKTGALNLAISGYVRSLANEMDTLIDLIDARHDQAVDTLSRRIDGLNLHERTLPALADLAIGYETFLEYAVSIEAISEEELKYYRETSTLALIQIAQHQASEQDSERPELTIIELLQQLFGSRQACLRDRLTNEEPDAPTAMGWKVQKRETYSGSDTQFIPARHEIGWVDDEHVYLMPGPTSQALQAIARDSRVVVPSGERQIGAILMRSGVALPGDGGKATRSIEVGAHSEDGGMRKRAIRIHRATLFPETSADHKHGPDNVTEFRKVPA